MEENIIPDKFILNNTSKIEGYSDYRRNAKIQAKKKEFIETMTKHLSFLDIDDRKYSASLMVAVCQSAEDFFTKRKQGAIKKEVVIACVKKFFNDDELLCERFIDIIFPQIIQSSPYRRIKNAVLFFLLSLQHLMQQK